MPGRKATFLARMACDAVALLPPAVGGVQLLYNARLRTRFAVVTGKDHESQIAICSFTLPYSLS